MSVRAVVGIVCSRPALTRCVPTALVVGTLLSAINQGTVILDGDATVATWVRVVFNYLIPFAVSNIGFVSATLHRDRD
ncbi:MAG: nitrate/nitrite transporter NrtS [Tepidisphaeraceae bacterium]